MQSFCLAWAEQEAAWRCFLSLCSAASFSERAVGRRMGAWLCERLAASADSCTIGENQIPALLMMPRTPGTLPDLVDSNLSQRGRGVYGSFFAGA